MDLVVTTVREHYAAEMDTARQFASALNVPFVQRESRSVGNIKAAYGVNNILVFSRRKGPVVYTEGGEFFFHLSMAELRIKNIINGKDDHMVTAMELKSGMSVLDCTLGLGTDAIVASFIAGTAGKVIGLEHSPVVALVTRYGLQNFSGDNSEINHSMRNIQVCNLDYHQYLTRLPEKSFDIVYFDPMFRHPIQSSSNLKPLRYLADARPLDTLALQRARRIARNRVIVKETSNSPEFTRLGITTVFGGKYSSIQYGMLEAGG
ncbi:MAG: class I SAM-dependent methyltransferase [Veillonellales bacterium]